MLKDYLKEIYNEAIPLDTAKEYVKGWKKERHADWFENKNRIYLPLVETKESENKTKTEIEKEIENKLKDNNFEVQDYISGTVKNLKYNRVEKLGKVLQKIDTNLFQKYQNDPERASSKNKEPIVVISRHPYDIAGMSTDRGWTSCKNLGTKNINREESNPTGSNRSFIKDEVFSMLIAYLINPDDKNIKNPIARVLLVPYISSKNDIAYFVQKKVYGEPGNLKDSFIKT
jgi:hypothetical protein